MKTVIMIIGIAFLSMAALATPIAVCLGVYDWVGNDVQFKFALWFGLKSWVAMISTGLIVGLPCAAIAS